MHLFQTSLTSDTGHPGHLLYEESNSTEYLYNIRAVRFMCERLLVATKAALRG